MKSLNTLRKSRTPRAGKKKRGYKLNRPEYITPAYQAFVRQVRVRDGVKCQFPGCKKRRFGIEVHHIIRWEDNSMLRYNPDNGICLCTGCHIKITGYEAEYARMLFSIVQTNKMKQRAKNG